MGDKEIQTTVTVDQDLREDEDPPMKQPFDDTLADLVGNVPVTRSLPAAQFDQLSDETLERALASSNALIRSAAERYKAIILDRPSSSRFCVGLVNEWNVDTRRAVSKLLATTTQFIEFSPLTEAQFTVLLSHAYGNQTAHESEMIATARETKDWAFSSTDKATAKDVERGAINFNRSGRVSEVTRQVIIDLSNDEEMTRLSRLPIETLAISDFTKLSLWYCIRAKASDWHLEHGVRMGSRIRFRIDGVLHTKFKGLPLEVGRRIANSATQMSGKDYSDIQRIPVDGTITVLITRQGRVEDVELRYVGLPTRPLPEVVLRSQSEVITDITKLGLLKIHYAQVNEMLSQTQGIILVTGPTGSGKTNSLAAYRARLEEPDNRKIISMEDPIEIYSDLTSQMPITRENTWEIAFRGMLRSDPDVIIVGELRSKHSVATALDAATTGHLVFATFHTSDVETTFARLIKRGVPPEQLSDSLVGIQAQRLARTLCRCKEVDEVLSEAHGITLYKPKGCPVCLGIGYKGRTALPEILVINEEIKDYMASGMNHKEIVSRAIASNLMLPMEEVARAKVLAGLTTFQEIDRVAKFTEAKSREAERKFYEEERRARGWRDETDRTEGTSAASSTEEDADAIDAEYEDVDESEESDDPLIFD